VPPAPHGEVLRDRLSQVLRRLGFAESHPRFWPAFRSVEPRAATVAGLQSWPSTHGAHLVEPLSRSEFAHCIFVIGPVLSIAAQTCCAPICDVDRCQGDIHAADAVALPPPHLTRHVVSRLTSSLQLHCFWTSGVTFDDGILTLLSMCWK
jgi:hypothetical protein